MDRRLFWTIVSYVATWIYIKKDNKMRLTRRNLRKMILQEMRLLSEADDWNAKIEALTNAVDAWAEANNAWVAAEGKVRHLQHQLTNVTNKNTIKALEAQLKAAQEKSATAEIAEEKAAEARDAAKEALKKSLGRRAGCKCR